MKITYLSENPYPKYIKQLNEAKSITDVAVLVEEYSDIFPESKLQLEQIEFSFKEFEEIISQMKNNKFNEKLLDKYGEILIPRRSLEAEFLCQKFHVPFGTAYIRLNEEVWSKLK